MEVRISEIHSFSWKCPRCWLEAHADVIDKATGQRRTELECWNCKHVVQAPVSQPEKMLKEGEVTTGKREESKVEGFNSKSEDEKGTNISRAIMEQLSAQEKLMTEAEIMMIVKGRTGLKRKALRSLVQNGRIQRHGKGSKGSVFKYSCSLVPESELVKQNG